MNALTILKLVWKPVVIVLSAGLLYWKISSWIDDYQEMKQAYETSISQLQRERDNARIEAESAKATVEELRRNEERLELLLADALERQDQIRTEANRQVDVFQQHNFTELTKAKPGLIERLANKASKERMTAFEEAFNN